MIFVIPMYSSKEESLHSKRPEKYRKRVVEKRFTLSGGLISLKSETDETPQRVKSFLTIPLLSWSGCFEL